MNEDDDDEEVSETQEGIKNINYILAGVIGLTVVLLLGALVMYTNDSGSSSDNTGSSGKDLLKKYSNKSGFDKYKKSDSMNFDISKSYRNIKTFKA